MSLLDLVLRPGALSVRFQPIFDIRPAAPVPHAIECLIRGPQRSTLEAPDLLFEYARRKREEANVDRAAVATIAEAAATVHPESRLHVNVHASTMGRDTSFTSFMRRVFENHGIDMGRIVVEIVEHTDYVEERAFLRSLADLRAAGCGIALDDVGSGRANFRMMLVCQPSQLKIDRVLVQGCAEDRYRSAILRSLRQLAQDFGIEIVVEGIETRDDLDTVRDIGIEYAQGYLLARPMTSAELLATPFGLARALQSVASVEPLSA
jgi:EAL domain-containing protein (putative c-di-GMP-specific phosphodiesterase class I)